MSEKIEHHIAEQLASLPPESHRKLIPSQLLPGGRIKRGENTYIDFASNDYLGLAHSENIRNRSKKWADKYGNSSGASRLVCGHSAQFEMVEEKIANMKGTETALIMNSGFQANASILASLLDLKTGPEKKVLLFTDKLNHASLHSGARMAGIRQIRYRHNDLEHLSGLLEKYEATNNPSFIVTESVFSMDGDVLDVKGVSELAQKYSSFLYIDEAHATGVLGENGAGLCKGKDAPLIMGTFGKALGSFGAYIACSRSIKDYLVNTCPGFIYATALPPSILGAIDAALDLLPHLEKERQDLKKNSNELRRHLSEIGFDCLNSTTQIIPVVIGSNRKVLRAGKILEENGILCGIIRPPTVPPNSARLRICLSSSHTQSQISHLVKTLKNVASEIIS